MLTSVAGANEHDGQPERGRDCRVAAPEVGASDRFTTLMMPFNSGQASPEEGEDVADDARRSDATDAGRSVSE
jgi:hypothetical protein